MTWSTAQIKSSDFVFKCIKCEGSRSKANQCVFGKCKINALLCALRLEGAQCKTFHWHIKKSIELNCNKTKLINQML